MWWLEKTSSHMRSNSAPDSERSVSICCSLNRAIGGSDGIGSSPPASMIACYPGSCDCWSSFDCSATART